METKSSITIQVPTEKVFKYAANPENFSSYISCINDIDNIKPKKPSPGQTFEWSFNLGGILLQGKGEMTKLQPSDTFEITTSGNATTVWKFLFKEVPQGTRVNLMVYYDIESIITDKIGGELIVKNLCDMLVKQIMKNLKIIKETRNR